MLHRGMSYYSEHSINWESRSAIPKVGCEVRMMCCWTWPKGYAIPTIKPSA